MDNVFPHQLYPHLYLDGPPEVETKHNYGGWGSFERVLPVNPGPGDAEQSSTRPEFVAQHAMSGEEWVPVKPTVTPLLPPFKDAKVFSGDPDPMDFPEHMQYFYQHYFMDAFSTMGHLLQENFSFKKKKADVMPMWWSRGFIKGLNYKRCETSHLSNKIRGMHHLLTDLVGDIPPSLLSSLLFEELTFQKERKQFSSETTGGALGFVPFHEDQRGRDGCLIYPGGVAMDKLCFHRVVQPFNGDDPPSFDMQSQPFVFQLNGAIRQLSVGNMEHEGNVAVRSDYLCGFWELGDTLKPRLVDVLQTKDRFSCVTISPHLPNELLVVNELGAAYLWTPPKGLQKFRQETSNLYFNAKSPWRWCEFSCHPRVMVYADRTGAELTDIRSEDCTHTLFRIGKTPACVSGERVILAKYLGKSHANHHLINTQFSTYIMDERVPSVPMLKWNHMMDFPPIFACDLPAQTPSQNRKLLLASQTSQEIMFLQYTGGTEQACQAKGPIQRLFSPRESLSYLSSQQPHKKLLAQQRLSVPVTGFAALQTKDYLSVFQLSDVGDIFFQTLKLHTDQTTTNEDIPEQAISVECTVETAESENLPIHVNSDSQSSLSDSETEGFKLKSFQTVTNEDSVDDEHLNASDTVKDIRKDPLSCSIGNNPTCSTRPPNPSKDPDLQIAWSKWFKPIFDKASTKKRHSNFRRKRTDDLKGLKGKTQYKLMKDQLKRLRTDLKEVMRKKETLSHGVTYLPHLDVMPVPDFIDPDDWDDDVSQRLAASWEGNWKQWWDEKLGLNHGKKIEALRKRRQRQKQARARSRISLSGSFVSSVNYQESVLSLPSIGSQVLASDDETSDKSHVTTFEEWRSRSETNKKTPVMLKRFLDDQLTMQEPIRSPLNSPQSQRRRPDQDRFTSLSSFQVERPISSTPSVAVELDSGPHPASLSSTRMPNSQSNRRKEFYHNSLPTSQTSTQNFTPDDGFTLSQIHLSSPPQSRLSLSSQRFSQFKSSSQASQTKKKSRMGF